MHLMLDKFKEYCTSRRLNILFGVIINVLIVVVVVLAVTNSIKSIELKESRRQLEILELYIQAMEVENSNLQGTTII
ncbi:uncharacterized protein ACN2A1_009078 [Glossina fuscipes fuscipes]